MANCPICMTEGALLRKISRTDVSASIRSQFGLELPVGASEVDFGMWRCPRCTLEYCDPMSPGNSVFYHWLADQPWYFPGQRWEWDVVIDEVNRQGRKSLLEVGCGSGIFLKRLQERLSIRAIGLDLTEGVVASCRAQNLEVYQGAVEDFARDHGTQAENIDCAVAFHCLEHVPDPVAFVRSMVELVGVGGAVFVSTPYSPISYERAWLDPLNYPPHHMTRWNKKAYERLADVLQLKAKFFLPKPASSLSRTARSFGLLNRTQATQRRRGMKLFKMLFSPLELMREIMHQRSRDRINGTAAADVVLVQFLARDVNSEV